MSERVFVTAKDCSRLLASIGSSSYDGRMLIVHDSPLTDNEIETAIARHDPTPPPDPYDAWAQRVAELEAKADSGTITSAERNEMMLKLTKMVRRRFA